MIILATGAKRLLFIKFLGVIIIGLLRESLIDCHRIWISTTVNFVCAIVLILYVIMVVEIALFGNRILTILIGVKSII